MNILQPKEDGSSDRAAELLIKYPESVDLVDAIKAATTVLCILTRDPDICKLSQYGSQIPEFKKPEIENVRDVLLHFSYLSLQQASSDIGTAEEASSQLTWANLEAKLKALPSS